MDVIKGENFLKLADHVLSYYGNQFHNPSNIKDGDIVYCDTRDLIKFKKHLLKRKNLVIITHNCIGGVLDEAPKPNWRDGHINCVNSNEFEGCFRYWFAKNCYSKKKNIIPIPIGFENSKWDKTGIKKRIQEEHKDRIIPTPTAYLNINVKTQKSKRELCVNECRNIKSIFHQTNRLSYADYISETLQHSFIISPDGNGIDCHRHWEALFFNRIPVIKNKEPLYRLYHDAPVLWVNEWTDLKDMNLSETYKRLKQMPFNREKLFQKYWDQYILEKIKL